MSNLGSTLIDGVNVAGGAGSIYSPMACFDAADWYVRESASEGWLIVSGCAISASGTAGKVDMSIGVTLQAGVEVAAAAVTAFATTITTLASGLTSGQALWVACEVDSTGALNFNSGTAATVSTNPNAPGGPVKPTPSTARVVVAWIYVPFGATAVDALTSNSNTKAKILEARIGPSGSLYALLAGHVGGQTLNGDTASGGNLTLSSTAHATKGKILFGTSGYDEANNRLGIGTSSPAYPVDESATVAANSGAFRMMNQAGSLDAASATTSSATLNGIYSSLTTGNTATALTGSLTGVQFLSRHDSSGSGINLTTLYGMLGQALLGGVGSTNTPTATSIFGGNFQAVNRSNQSGTAVSTEMTGVESSCQQVGQGTIALTRGFAAILTHVAGVATAGTTTLEIGYDLGFSFHTAGTVTTAIGLRLQAWPSGPTYTNGPYGLSVEGSTSLNWIRGNTQIGGSSRPTAITPTLLVNGSMLSNTASGGIGYATGAGSTTSAQGTNKSTGVTINAVTGQITMNAAALLTAATVGFTFTNSAIAATDVVIVNISSGGTVNSYGLWVDAVAAGSCHIMLRNFTGGTLSEAVVINFAVIKGVTS